MSRWLLVLASCGILLPGCGERIERKPMTAPRTPQAAAERAGPETTRDANLPTDTVAADRPATGEPARDKPSTGKMPADEQPESGMALPRGPAGDTPPAEQLPAIAVKDGEITVERIRLTVPKTWVQKPPRSGFVLAEFSLPRADGDLADGRLTVSQAGGSVASNVERWRKQFGEKPEKESREKMEIHGVAVTLVDFSGTYQDQRGPFAPAVEAPGYRMLGAIAEVDGQLYFLKAYGPAKTMAARASEFREFVGSLKAADKP